MLFYITLLLTSLVVTLMILWLYKLTVFFVRKVFRSTHDQAGVGPVDHVRARRKASRAWGIRAHATPTKQAQTHPASANNRAGRWSGYAQSVHKEHPELATSTGADLSSYLSRQDSETSRRSVDWKRELGRPIRDDSRPAFRSDSQKSGQNVASKHHGHKGGDTPWGW